MLSGGYITLLRVRRMTIRMHWTTPLAALLFSRLRFAPGFWLGYLVVILVHELGHALIVRASGAQVRNVDLTGSGGECTWDGRVTPVQRALIAWGGIAGQLVLLAVVAAVLWSVDVQVDEFAAEFFDACTFGNVFIMAFNLIPFRPLDGAEAWKIVPLAWRARKRRVAARRAEQTKAARLRAVAEIAKLEVSEEFALNEPEVDEVVERLLARAGGASVVKKEKSD